MKHLIGRRFADENVQQQMKNWPFAVIDDNSKPKISVDYKGEMRIFSPEQILSMILAKIKDAAEAQLGTLVSDAVITVPANFTDSQRQATQTAGTIAGLKVLRIINEPTAAAIAYGLDRKESERNVMIFDLGGGTSNVAILTVEAGVIELKATACDTQLNGQNFDKRLVLYFVENFEHKYRKDIKGNERALLRLHIACERAKHMLRWTDEASIEVDSLLKGFDLHATISRARFEELNADLFQRMQDAAEQALSEAEMAKDDIDDVLLIGGCSHIPKLQELVREFCGREVNMSIDPLEALAHGAAVQAAILKSQDQMVPEMVTAVPLTLGVETAGGLMTAMIQRNSAIPKRAVRIY